MKTVVAALIFYSIPLLAQGNYEIQVYPSETVKPGCTMVELHSNITVEGFKTSIDGVLPDEHQWHETIEITHGVNDWFEVGWYIFTSEGPGQGFNWVGDHIRPRVRAPESWKWPVSASISFEFGYQRRIFSTDTWTLEIRPILDRTIGTLVHGVQPDVRPVLSRAVGASGAGFFAGFQSGLRHHEENQRRV